MFYGSQLLSDSNDAPPRDIVESLSLSSAPLHRMCKEVRPCCHRACSTSILQSHPTRALGFYQPSPCIRYNSKVSMANIWPNATFWVLSNNPTDSCTAIPTACLCFLERVSILVGGPSWVGLATESRLVGGNTGGPRLCSTPEFNSLEPRSDWHVSLYWIPCTPHTHQVPISTVSKQGSHP